MPTEPEAAEWCLDEYVNVYIVRFPLSNEINTTKTDSSLKVLKAAVKKVSDYNDVDVCMSSAVQYSSNVWSYHVYLYSTLCNR